FQYYLHSPHAFDEADGQRFEVAGDSARCLIELLTPRGLEVTRFEGYDPPIRPPYDEQIREHHLKAETAEPAERGEFIAVIGAARAGDETAGRAEHEQRPAGHALRVALPDGEAIVLLRTGEGELAAWGLSTDGSIAAARLDADGQPVGFFGTGGAEVRWRGNAAE
ncbi:MAG: hypothetical protein ACOCX2_13020, partial [Armatimonadota bacterium]